MPDTSHFVGCMSQKSGIQINQPHFILPHPRAHFRTFSLIPKSIDVSDDRRRLIVWELLNVKL